MSLCMQLLPLLLLLLCCCCCGCCGCGSCGSCDISGGSCEFQGLRGQFRCSVSGLSFGSGPGQFRIDCGSVSDRAEAGFRYRAGPVLACRSSCFCSRDPGSRSPPGPPAVQVPSAGAPLPPSVRSAVCSRPRPSPQVPLGVLLCWCVGVLCCVCCVCWCVGCWCVSVLRCCCSCLLVDGCVWFVGVLCVGRVCWCVVLVRRRSVGVC